MQTEPNPMKAARQTLKWTQARMAEQLDVSQPTIARMEADAAQIDQRTRLALTTLLNTFAA